MIKAIAAIIVCLVAANSPALARAAKTPTKAHKPAANAEANKPPGKRAPSAIAKAYAGMPADARLAIQADLAWIGDYEGAPGGDFDDQRVIDAVKLFQQRLKSKDTGILDDQDRARLAGAAEPSQQAVGWQVIDDPATGARFGLPQKLVAPIGDSRAGSQWISGHGQIRIEAFRLSEANLPALFDQEKKTPKGRTVEWSELQSDSFVISGTQGLKNFVVRSESSGSEVRGITVLYDQATAGIMAPVAVAVANSFHGFPDPNAALPPGGRPAVEYGTATVVDRNGDLLATGQGTAGCAAIAVPGLGHAERIAEDAASDLALLRLYGARGLLPAGLAGEAQGGELTLVGIADPLAQQGGDAVSKEPARRNGDGIEPAPRSGFSGAAAIDAQGRFAGMVELKSAIVAGNAAVSRQAVLVPAAAVRDFLKAHGITPAAGQDAIDQSVVRVICVRN